MKIYDRVTGEYTEEQEFQQGLLQFLYETVPGRVLLRLAVSPAFSRWRARYQYSARSKKDIMPFAERFGIDLSGFDVSSFDCFNAFFTRKREYKTDAADGEFIAIADSRLSAYPVSDQLALTIKHTRYTLGELTDKKVSLTPFSGGTCLVFRLAMQDYHRYVFPDSGEIVSTGTIPGVLHTVRPISEKHRVYARNSREWTLLCTDHFGSLLQIEVGAMLVGKIRNHPNRYYCRLDEKGYFEYGGSTILLLVPPTIQIDPDIILQTKLGFETKVTIGERIGIIQREEEPIC